MSEIVELADGLQIWHDLHTMLGDVAHYDLDPEMLRGNALQWVSKEGEEFRWYWELGQFLDLTGSGPIVQHPYKRRGHVICQLFDEEPHGLFIEIGGGEL